MKNITSKLTAVAVLTFIAFFGAASLAPCDNSEKTVIPALTWDNIADGGFGSGLSSLAAQHFAFSDSWRSVGSRIDSGISGSIVNSVYIADDRLIAADISERESTDKCAEIVNAFADSYNGAVYFAAVPTSAGVYGDALPSHLSRVTEKQQTDRFYEQLSGDIRRVDAYNLMKMLSDDRIYLRSDTKWTMYGAYCLYRTVIQKLGSQPVSFDKYTIRHVTNEYRGDLYKRTLYMKCEPDILDIYEYPDGAQVTECVSVGNDGREHDCSLYDTDALGSDDMYRLYLGERQPLVRITTDVNNDRRLLLIGSECAAGFVPFLTQHYSEITVYLPEYADRPLSDFADPNDYEQTLFLFGIDAVKTEILEKTEMR